jgi:uncharacterized protein YndB with AHSA1/START domain
MPVDEVTITAIVALPVEEAFTVFTEDIDRWWVRETSTDTVVRFEGDRLVAASIDGAELLATVSEWDPPTRIAMDWNGPHSQPGDMVGVDFHPESDGTRVTVRHRRGGVGPEQVIAAILGLWWGDLLSRLQHRGSVGIR